MPFTQTRVLVYDSSNLQCELLSTGLKRLHNELDVNCVRDLESLTGLLVSAQGWVVIISDGTLQKATVSFVKLLRARFPEIPLIFLLQEGREEDVLEAFRLGAKGIVYSNDGLAQLAKCIERVAEGDLWVRHVDLNLIFEKMAKPSGRLTNISVKAMLSPREEEISRLVADGMSNREISQTLKISESTVKNCLFHVFNKLGISNRVELTRHLNLISESQGLADFSRDDPRARTAS